MLRRPLRRAPAPAPARSYLSTVCALLLRRLRWTVGLGSTPSRRPGRAAAVDVLLHTSDSVKCLGHRPVLFRRDVAFGRPAAPPRPAAADVYVLLSGGGGGGCTVCQPGADGQSSKLQVVSAVLPPRPSPAQHNTTPAGSPFGCRLPRSPPPLRLQRAVPCRLPRAFPSDLRGFALRSPFAGFI